MNTKVNALKSLYQRNKITENGLRKAVVDGIITEAEFKIITNIDY